MAGSTCSGVRYSGIVCMHETVLITFEFCFYHYMPRKREELAKLDNYYSFETPLKQKEEEENMLDDPRDLL